MELDPNADRVQSMLGAALLSLGDHDAALEALEQAIRLNPEMYQNHFNLGMTLEKLDRNKEAIEQYIICLEREPGYAPARERLEALTKNR